MDLARPGRQVPSPLLELELPVNPTTGQPEGGFDDMYVYGLNIDVSATGNVAAFNFQLFVQTIVLRSRSSSASPKPSAISSR